MDSSPLSQRLGAGQSGFPRYADQAYYETEIPGARAGHGRRWASFIGIAALAVLGVWIVLTSVYIILHDDLLTTAVRDRLRMQTAYEDRIAGLRGEIGAVTGRLMLNQDEFDAKVERLNARQALLEERQRAIAALISDIDDTVLALGEDDTTASLQGEAGVQPASVSSDETIGDQASLVPDNTIRLAFANQFNPETVSRPGYDLLQDPNLPTKPQNRADRDLLRLAVAQSELEARQFKTLNQLEKNALAAGIQITQAFSRLGFEPREIYAEADTQTEAVGGPLIQMSPQVLPSVSSFERQIHRIRTHSAKASGLYRALLSFPLRRPLDGHHDITSRFGSRLDPFRRTPAHHSGLDYRAGRGTPVRATADGNVVMAGRNGGYGRMVELKHANGVTTRYAHMSSIAVKKGEVVEAGDIVGRVGSSGRSTGPHLHYETRLNGTAINPARFLKVGAEVVR